MVRLSLAVLSLARTTPETPENLFRLPPPGTTPSLVRESRLSSLSTTLGIDGSYPPTESLQPVSAA